MAYFSQIVSYQTYAGQDADFHYDYNGNSGGGHPYRHKQLWLIWECRRRFWKAGPLRG